MVNVPVRGLVVPLAATEYETVVVPVPLVALVIVSQEADEDVVQGQAVSVKRETVPVELPAATDAPVGERV
jgi:hypothetical protein